MTLLESTQNAIDFTRRLKAALSLDDLELGQEILVLRGEAMAAFDQAHHAAQEKEKENCREIIQALVEADEELREITTDELTEIARDFRENMVSNLPGPKRAYFNNPAQACIDRKA